MDLIKNQQKDSNISEDEQKQLSDTIQSLTDDKIKEIESKYSDKEKEILQI